MKREFLRQCQDYNPAKHRIGNMYMSEKLDGQRAFWDGGITRGLTNVPFAMGKTATGLWSRYGKVIYAPDWFLDTLPKMPLDGELFTKRGDRQNCRSIVSRHSPDDRWNQVNYMVFGSPPLSCVFADGKIDLPHMKITFKDLIPWAEDLADKCSVKSFSSMTPFEEVYSKLEGLVHTQILLPRDENEAQIQLAEYLDRILKLGGEGVILQARFGIWLPERTWDALKVKPVQDAEGIVAGFTWGEGKLSGLMGSMIVSWKGKTFNLSGFTEAERVVRNVEGNPVSDIFPIGSEIPFQYRTVSDDGIPVEAKYWREF